MTQAIVEVAPLSIAVHGHLTVGKVRSCEAEGLNLAIRTRRG
jgi:hypothetical protein